MQIKQKDTKIEVNLNILKKSNCFNRWLLLLSIPTLVLFGILLGYFAIIPFQVQMHSVIMIAIIYIIYTFFAKHNAFYATCRFRNSVDDLEDELNEYINKNRLTLAKKTKSNAPFDTFMQDFTSKFRNDNFASVASSLFPTLGILGTFISIALTMPDFKTDNAVGLEREISQLLGGVATAFYVSIYGIFLSLWWIFFEKRGMSEFDRDLYKIKDRVKRFFWTKEEIEQIHFVKSMENFEYQNRVFETITANEFIENLQNILQQRVDMFESVIHHEQELLQKTTKHFNTLLKEIDQGTGHSREVLRSYNELASNIKIMTNQIEISASLLRDTLERMSSKEDSISKTQSMIKDQLEVVKKEHNRLKKGIHEPKIIDNR